MLAVFGAVFALSGCDRASIVTLRDRQDGQIVSARIGEKTYYLNVAKSDGARTKGLSNRSDLDDKAGMLFIFSNTDYHSFWMKDTLLPLEIIWLDENFVVVDKKLMAVEKDPSNPIASYSPRSPARYVIEINPLDDTEDVEMGDKIDLEF